MNLNLTLKQLNDLQGAIARVGSLTIALDQPAIAYRMSKNVEQLTKARENDIIFYQRTRFDFLRAYGTQELDENGKKTNTYSFLGENKGKHDKACDELDATPVAADIRIRPVEFLLYLEAIKPETISPSEISMLEFLFIFPAEFEDEEKPTPKQSAKAIADKKPESTRAEEARPGDGS